MDGFEGPIGNLLPSSNQCGESSKEENKKKLDGSNKIGRGQQRSERSPPTAGVPSFCHEVLRHGNQPCPHVTQCSLDAINFNWFRLLLQFFSLFTFPTGLIVAGDVGPDNPNLNIEPKTLNEGDSPYVKPIMTEGMGSLPSSTPGAEAQEKPAFFCVFNKSVW